MERLRLGVLSFFWGRSDQSKSDKAVFAEEFERQGKEGVPDDPIGNTKLDQAKAERSSVPGHVTDVVQDTIAEGGAAVTEEVATSAALGGLGRQLTWVRQLSRGGRLVAGPAKWTLGRGKSASKWADQMNKRGWTSDQISEAMQKGRRFPADNVVNKGNSATRYVHPDTGRSVVVDDVTKEVIHVGGDGFEY